MSQPTIRIVLAGLLLASLGIAGCQDNRRPISTGLSGDYDANIGQPLTLDLQAGQPATQASTQVSAPVKPYEISPEWLNHNPKPSLNGLSRADWEPVTFKTEAGIVYHYNYYHRDLPTGFEKHHDELLANADRDPTVVLDNPKTELFSEDNTIELFLQPLKAGFDTALMFPVMFVKPPWGAAQSPDKLHYAPAVKNDGGDITAVPASTAPAPTMTPEGTPVVPAYPQGSTTASPVSTQPISTEEARAIPPLQVQPSNIPPLEINTGMGQ